MILGALWLSKDKPTMTTYLAPLMASINELSYEGKFAVLCMYNLSDCRSLQNLMDQVFLFAGRRIISSVMYYAC